MGIAIKGYVPAADMRPVAGRAPETFSLVLDSTPLGGGGVWNNEVDFNPSPPGTFGLVHGSSSQNK